MRNSAVFWISLLVTLGLCCGSLAGEEKASELWLHQRCQTPPCDKVGPFVHLGDGGILTVDSENALVSRDGGETWNATPLFVNVKACRTNNERALLRTRQGVIVLAFYNLNEMVWTWDSQLGELRPGARLPTYAIRSLDDGKTWQNLQMLHEAWTGDIRDIIETSDGLIVFTSMQMLLNPTRHVIVTYSSDDQGVTWARSNIIDLGGKGDHGGAMEATIEELEDGRMWMLIRTNLDRFWEAFSDDGGKFWRVIRPSNIDASSAPGMLKRLSSGRLVLVWNRLYPVGEDNYQRRGGDGLVSEVPASWHREELSIAFSDSEGETWSKPVVIARKPGARLSYPYVFEYQPGELWITTTQGGVRIMLREKEFVIPR